MSDIDNMISLKEKTTAAKHDLGALICKFCGDVIATLPTNGVTKIYGVCDRTSCWIQEGSTQ